MLLVVGVHNVFEGVHCVLVQIHHVVVDFHHVYQQVVEVLVLL
jgi:hypothetical protein